jgi:hypothetical protein
MFAKFMMFALVLAGTPSCAQAKAECQNFPPQVSEYLRANKGWSVVKLTDLPDDDKQLWEQSHGGNCPGYAEAYMFGSKAPSYALALLGRSSGVNVEKLVLLQGNAKGSQTIFAASPITTPFVTWKIKPGQYSGASGKRKNILGDSVIYEKMESISYQFYVENGKVVRMVVSE